MSIVTKTGDKGETSLMYGRRVSKADPHVDAYGCIDELTAALGLARSICSEKFVSEQIFAVQKELIIVMGELATTPQDRERYLKDGFHVTTAAMVNRITAVIVELEKDRSLYPKDWVIPGGTAVSAALDFARTTFILRFNPEILRYLNRLSDLCWILARYAEKNVKPETA